MYKKFFKRVIDFTISVVALFCLSPILLVVTIWLHFANKGAGAFFLQERPGKDGKISLYEWECDSTNQVAEFDENTLF